MLEKLRVGNVRQTFFQSYHRSFLGGIEVGFTGKTKASDPTKREFYSMRTLWTLYPNGLNIEREY